MARSYLSSGQWIAQRENRVRNARRRKSYSSLNDQLLAETTAICTEKKLNSKRGKYAITHAAHYTLHQVGLSVGAAGALPMIAQVRCRPSLLTLSLGSRSCFARTAQPSTRSMRFVPAGFGA